MKIIKLVSVGFGCCAFLAVLITSIQSVCAESDVCSEAAGKWVSSAGSVLNLEVAGNTLSGTFDKKFPSPYNPGIRSLRGSITLYHIDSKDPSKYSCPLSFSIDWPKQGTYFASVTSYTGRYDPQKQQIKTVFLTVNPLNPGYSAVSVTTDLFSRQPIK